jgi:apolipoprotein N-acyltransferase
VGSVISFEGSFARYTRQTVGSGAQLLVVATSQASYPLSNASDQFLAMTRMRAAELGVDVIHVAVTGRSAIVTGGGEFAGVTPLAEPATLVAPVRIRTAGPTLYTRWGEWVQGLAVLAMFGAALSRRRAGAA